MSLALRRADPVRLRVAAPWTLATGRGSAASGLADSVAGGGADPSRLWARLPVTSPSRPRPLDGVAHHGGHSPAGRPLPDIRESARPLRHSRLGPHAYKFGSIRGELYWPTESPRWAGRVPCRAIPMNKRTLPDQSPGRSSRRLKRVCLPPESSSQCQRVALETCVLAR